jgi:hypothetical protein
VGNILKEEYSAEFFDELDYMPTAQVFILS